MGHLYHGYVSHNQRVYDHRHCHDSSQKSSKSCLHVVELPEEKSARDGHVLCAAGTSWQLVVMRFLLLQLMHTDFFLNIIVYIAISKTTITWMNMTQCNDQSFIICLASSMITTEMNHEIWTIRTWQDLQTIKQSNSNLLQWGANNIDPIRPMGLEKKEGISKVGMLLGFDHGSGENLFWALCPDKYKYSFLFGSRSCGHHSFHKSLHANNSRDSSSQHHRHRSAIIGSSNGKHLEAGPGRCSRALLEPLDSVSNK